MINILKNCFICLGTILVIVGVGILCYKEISFKIDEYNADIEKSKEIITVVDNDYNSFNKVVVQYKENIVLVSQSLNVYFEDFSSKNIEVLKEIENVKTKLNDIVEEADRMSNNCKYDLNNMLMRQQCETFSINYKSMVDAYSNMIDEYNKVVEKYNKYAASSGKESISLYNDSKEEEFYVIYNKF